MLLIRFLLLGLASLNCSWALGHLLTEYVYFLIQSFDPLNNPLPPDSTMLVAWLTIATASGSGAFVLFRASYKQRQRTAKIIAVPALAQQAEQTSEVAA
jgi:hypothetical protein